jgi:signal transduction histidine kinase/CheY-like chemotaxis protein
VVFLVGGWAASRRFSEAVLTGLRHNVQADALNQELRLARDRAEAAAQARAHFLAVMSHEIRTPLNGVLGTLDLLVRSPLQLPQQRLVQVARSSGQGLLQVLNDALDHAQLEAGELRLAPGPVAPRQLVAECQALFAATAQARGLRWQAVVDPDVPDWVETDAQRLRQVLLNLLGNALKFTEQGGVGLRVSVAAGAPPGLRFEVDDTGPGIAAEELPRLFQSFTQLQSGPTRRHGGTGLGLAISQRLVQALGGDIGVRSQPGVGSCFHFHLPAAPVAPPLRAAPPPAAEPPAAFSTPPVAGVADETVPLLRGTVLVAEDNEVNRLITAGMLEALGLHVVEAADGEQAWQRLQAGGIDLALVDMQMPVLDGAGLARRWRAFEAEHGRARLPLLALTANASVADQQTAQAAGMDLHLAKPCAMTVLTQALARWLPPA